jgi:hypothetical protein
MAKTIDYLAQFGIGKAPVTRKKNPAKRIGTAKPKRVSQVTKKAPSKRLVKRRMKNTDEGYFPNPIKLPFLVQVQNPIDKKFRDVARFDFVDDAKTFARSLGRKNPSHVYRVVK